MTTTSLHKWLLLLLLIVGCWSLFSNRVHHGETRILTWDVYGYYLHLPAFFKYNDIEEYAFVDQHIRDYAPSDANYQISRHEGIITPTYTMGLAILWIPFYALADIWAHLDPRFPADGLSQPYQWMILIGGWLAFAIGMYLLSLFLLRYLQPVTILIVLVGLGLGTNLFYYAAHEPGMPHVWLFAMYSGLLLLLDRMIPQPRWWQGLILGVLLAIMALCRPTEALAVVLIPALIWQRCGGWQGLLDHLRSNASVYLLGVVAGILILIPQIWLWKVTTDQWVFNPYAAAGHRFDFTSPYLLEGLFSFRKGWLIYTPMMVLSLAGLFLLKRNVREWAPGILIFVCLNIWIVLSWYIWWYAGSFGMRALVQSYAILALPMGLLLEKSYSRSWWRDSLFAYMIVASLLNLFQTWQIRKGILKHDGMNFSFYKAAFGKFQADRNRLRLMDIPETPPREPLTRELVGEVSVAKSEAAHEWKDQIPGWPVKGLEAFSPGVDLWLTDSMANLLAGQWVEVSAQVYAGSDFAPYTQGARLVLDVQREGRERKWYGLHLTRLIDKGVWWPVKFEVKLPDDLRAGDRILAVVWSQTDRDDFWVNHIRLQRLGF